MRGIWKFRVFGRNMETSGWVGLRKLERADAIVHGLNPPQPEFSVVEKFEEIEGRNPGEISLVDLPNVLKLRKELCEAQSFSESQIPDALLERLLSGGMEFPPVCAILGGILGQEVIKAISCKGEPLKNFFYFDAMDGKGVIEDISTPDPTS